MTVRLFVGQPLLADSELALPPGAARHAQVRRVQPGDTLVLFNGSGSHWPAVVTAVGRSSVQVQVGHPQPAAAAELPLAVTLAVAMPANERMDALVEKATELGVAQLQPLLTERSVLRLAGERADRKQAHWQAIAQAACEQCGRARVPVVAPVRTLVDWLRSLPAADGTRLVLSLRAGAQPLRLQALAAGAGAIAAGTATATATATTASTINDVVGARAAVAATMQRVTALSGPEGGLTDGEEDAARQHGFGPVTLGPRVLRADTAPLALLAWLALQAG